MVNWDCYMQIRFSLTLRILIFKNYGMSELYAPPGGSREPVSYVLASISYVFIPKKEE